MHEEVDRLVELYDGGRINRRQLVQRLLTIGLGMGAGGPRTRRPSAGTGRSRAGHQSRDSLCQRRGAFQSVLSAPCRASYPRRSERLLRVQARQQFLGHLRDRARTALRGLITSVLESKSYDAKRTHASIAAAFPDNHATIENNDQVYVQDPDGVRVQFADVATSARQTRSSIHELGL